MRQSKLPMAEKAFELVWQAIQKMPREQTTGLIPLTLCWRSILEQRLGHSLEATELRLRAMPLVDELSAASEEVPFLNLMSNALMDLGEYQRAIPFCEQLIQLMAERNKPLVVAELLEREGRCYSRSGLKEHAAVPLRAALKILRDYPGDPRLMAVLISLGNALRKSSPDEAEQFYKEAAEFYEAKAQLESATAPWVNLGILCSEQGRHAESLGYYERALHVRERNPATPPARVASLLNNMANCRRRMGEFNDALILVDRAIGMPKVSENSLIASLSGTRGQILHDAGSDEEAVLWLRKSYAEREKSSSPDLEALTENLQFEIKSLERLGRADDARDAEKKLARVRQAIEKAPQASMDLSAMTAEAKGAVMVELAFGGRTGGRYGLDDARTVAEQLSAILEDRDVGIYGGRVTIPECVTLLFYGEDAEAIYEAMGQFLADHSIFDGATVSIRQGKALRQVVMPQRVN